MEGLRIMKGDMSVSYTHLTLPTNREVYELYSNSWFEYAKNGWKKENDLVLKIGFDSSGLYDIGQERGYGATQNMWMKGISQSIFEASV